MAVIVMPYNLVEHIDGLEEPAAPTLSVEE
jgi:hypothetical protein